MLMKQLLHFVSWRNWGVIRTNPVLENTFVFWYLFLDQNQPFLSVVIELAQFLGLIFFMASYGFLLNDAVDCKRDLGHGIDNVFRGCSPSATSGVVLVALACTLPFVVRISADHALFLPIWLFWLLCTSLYSLPSVYLKGRGLVGLVAVALALRTLPIALVLVIFRPQPDGGWLIILAYLTLRGLSGDLSHQLTDYAADLADNLGTYVVRIGRERARRLLDRILAVERIGLLLICAWVATTLIRHTEPSAVIIAAHIGFVAVIGILNVYAWGVRHQGALGYDPHAPVYPVKDVYYLLHKSIPKIVLPLYLLALLILEDWRYLALFAPLALYFRLYSWSRLVNAIRLRPEPHTRQTTSAADTRHPRA